METLIDETNLTALDQEAAKRMLSNVFSSGLGCTHKHEYWTGAEKDCDYVLFSVHFYEFACPDCNKFYWLPWKPEKGRE